MRLRRASDLDELRDAPAGRYLAGQGWIHFCVSDALWGMVFFGRPARSHAEQLARSLALEFAPGVPRHMSYVDARRLDGADPDAFEVLTRFFTDHYDRARAQFSRFALVVPRGVTGAVVAGFLGALEPPCPFKVVEEPAAALGWLEQPVDVEPILDGVVEDVLQRPRIVEDTRAQLRKRLEAPDIEVVSRKLGLSVRTLQRRLREARTSFQRELVAVRIEEATRRLAETETEVTTIALELGFATLQQFSTQFRRQTALRPSEWRERHRRR